MGRENHQSLNCKLQDFFMMDFLRLVLIFGALPGAWGRAGCHLAAAACVKMRTMHRESITEKIWQLTKR